MTDVARTQVPRGEDSDGASLSLVDGVLVGALAAVGGAAFLSAFRGEDLFRPVLAAAVVGVLASLVASGLLRRGMGFSAVVAGVALAAAGVVVCEAGPGVLLPGLLDGPWTILTSAVPVRAEPDVLVVPFALAGASAFLGAEVAQRSRFPLVPVLPSLVVLVAGLLFGIDDRLPPVWVPTLWVGLALVTTGWRTSREAASTRVTASSVSIEAADDPRRPRGAHASSEGDGGPPRRSAGNAVRAAVVVCLVAVPVAAVARWAGPRLPGADEQERFALRELVDQPAQPEPLTNPLVEVTALQGGPDDPMFTAETSAAVERWRLAVLDTYDGREWRSQGQFLPAGVELSGPPGDGDGAGDDDGSAGDGRRVTQTIETAGLPGLWLPVADRVVEIDADGDLLFDAGSGVLLVDGNRLPHRYEAVSTVPERDATRLSGAAAADDEEAQAARALPGDMPDDVVATAEQITQGAATAYDRAVAIERFLAAGSGDEAYQLAVQELPSGHTLGHLRCLLLATDQCARRGSTEQFVAAFALLARTAGLPARVVVGFEGAGASGRDQVTAHEATAWAEVKFEGIGWVAFDPVPDPTVETTPPTTALPGSSGGTPDSQPATTVAQNTGDQAADDQDDDAGGADESSSGTTLLWVTGVVVVVLVLVVLPGLLRVRRRRRRRRAASPSARVAGAWAAAVEELRRGGLRLTRGSAVTDIVRAGLHRFAGAAEPLVPLGLMVNRAEFSRGEPGDVEADQAWQLSDTFATQRRKGRPLSRRIREYFTLA